MFSLACRVALAVFIVFALSLPPTAAFAAGGGQGGGQGTKTDTASTISIAPNSVAQGGSVTITGAVSPAPGCGTIQIDQLVNGSYVQVTSGSGASGSLAYTGFNTSGLAGQTLTFRSKFAPTGNCNYNESTSSTATLTVTASDTTPPSITPSVSGTLGSNGWYVSNVTVSWTVTDAESTVTSTSGCGTTTISSDTTGTTLTCTATSAGGTASQSVTIKRDATPPSVTATASRVTDSNGWYNHAVTVTFTATDATSLVASCDSAKTYSGPDSAAASVSGNCTDNAGNVGSATFNLKYDATPPTITGSRSPAANVYGWNNTDVTVSFACADNLSDVASCVGGTTVTTEGANQSVTGTATDNAGNTASTTVNGINIDKTKPTVSITGPSVVLQGNAASATVTASDDRSGLVSNPSGPLALDTTTAGLHTVTVTVTDKAGNSASASLTYTVWGVNGPFPPLGKGKTAFKAGSTIPVKFQITDGASLITTATGTVTIGSASAAFRWDATAQQYIANVQTDKSAAPAEGVAVVLNVSGVGGKTLTTIDLK